MTSRREYLKAMREQLDSYAHLFLPRRKVVVKTRSGSEVKERYDIARSPSERLRQLDVIDAHRP